jgi:excisionase family DNA binding protein
MQGRVNFMNKGYGTSRRATLPGDILTLRQLAGYLKCHPGSVYRLIKDGDVPYFRLGGMYRFQRSTIDNWIKKKTQAKA